MQEKTLIIIPARIGSTRLPEKALRMIGEYSMIEHVACQVAKAHLPHLYVATDDERIAERINHHGIKSVMTYSDLPSGTDRVYAAWQSLPNKDQFEYIINVQGDMPFIDPQVISEITYHIWQNKYDIITPVAKVGLDIALSNSNVKVVSSLTGEALYFSRNLIPSGASEFLYHIGIYAYKANSLREFVTLPPSSLETSEKLEQLRALENGMRIGLCEVNSIPISVDTEEDFEKALSYYQTQQ